MGISRAAYVMVATLVVAALAAPAALAADDLFIEAEEFETYGYNDLGGVEIGVEWCTGANGFMAAGGLDLPGEWIRLKVTFPAEACYESEIAYQSAYGDTVRLRVRMADAPGPGQEMTSDYMLTEGWGFG